MPPPHSAPSRPLSYLCKYPDVTAWQHPFPSFPHGSRSKNEWATSTFPLSSAMRFSTWYTAPSASTVVLAANALWRPSEQPEQPWRRPRQVSEDTQTHPRVGSCRRCSLPPVGFDVPAVSALIFTPGAPIGPAPGALTTEQRPRGRVIEAGNEGIRMMPIQLYTNRAAEQTKISANDDRKF